VLSTHLTEDIAAICSRVVVVDRGRVRFEGEPAALAAHAAGRVWLSHAPEPRAMLSWVTADGSYRHIGEPPVGATLSPPTLEDGYLVLTGPAVGEGMIEEIEVLPWR